MIFKYVARVSIMRADGDLKIATAFRFSTIGVDCAWSMLEDSLLFRAD